MNTCNGECLNQCQCECYNEETDEDYEVCVCGHREHNGYCPSDCCSPVECRNYQYCHTKLPKYITFIHNGMCANCDAMLGRHRITNEVDECCVCYENKRMIVLECNHKLCNDCLYQMSHISNNRCPMCRNSNTWSGKYWYKNLFL